MAEREELELRCVAKEMMRTTRNQDWETLPEHPLADLGFLSELVTTDDYLQMQTRLVRLEVERQKCWNSKMVWECQRFLQLGLKYRRPPWTCESEGVAWLVLKEMRKIFSAKKNHNTFKMALELLRVKRHGSSL